MRLSVLDQSPIPEGQTGSQALRNTLDLARTADRLGYHRYWVAEHHNMPAVAATNPPVMIGLLASATDHIRLGSGGVMLPNHAPLVVAEQFALLEAAFPGRIDLGIGRAPGTDQLTAAAQRHGCLRSAWAAVAHAVEADRLVGPGRPESHPPIGEAAVDGRLGEDHAEVVVPLIGNQYWLGALITPFLIFALAVFVAM